VVITTFRRNKYIHWLKDAQMSKIPKKNNVLALFIDARAAKGHKRRGRVLIIAPVTRKKEQIQRRCGVERDVGY